MTSTLGVKNIEFYYFSASYLLNELVSEIDISSSLTIWGLLSFSSSISFYLVSILGRDYPNYIVGVVGAYPNVNGFDLGFKKGLLEVDAFCIAGKRLVVIVDYPLRGSLISGSGF